MGSYLAGHSSRPECVLLITRLSYGRRRFIYSKIAVLLVPGSTPILPLQLVLAEIEYHPTQDPSVVTTPLSEKIKDIPGISAEFSRRRWKFDSWYQGFSLNIMGGMVCRIKPISAGEN